MLNRTLLDPNMGRRQNAAVCLVHKVFFCYILLTDNNGMTYAFQSIIQLQHFLDPDRDSL